MVPFNLVLQSLHRYLPSLLSVFRLRKEYSACRYMARGVSAAKEDVHDAIANVDKGLYPRAFCKIIPDLLAGDDAYCNIMHADGAGTKSSLAYLYWKETGDVSVWRGIAQVRNTPRV